MTNIGFGVEYFSISRRKGTTYFGERILSNRRLSGIMWRGFESIREWGGIFLEAYSFRMQEVVAQLSSVKRKDIVFDWL